MLQVDRCYTLKVDSSPSQAIHKYDESFEIPLVYLFLHSLLLNSHVVKHGSKHQTMSLLNPSSRVSFLRLSLQESAKRIYLTKLDLSS